MNLYFLKAKKIKNDEFYTSYNTVKKMLDDHIDYIKKTFKRVVLPFDTNDSQFVKYMQDHNVNYVNYDKIKINELHTIIQDGDIIISNPPFSKSKELFQELEKYNIKFMLIFFWLIKTCIFFRSSKIFKDINASDMIRVDEWTNTKKQVPIIFLNNIGIKYHKDEKWLIKGVNSNEQFEQYDDLFSVRVLIKTNKKNYHLLRIITQENKAIFLKIMFFDKIDQSVLDKLKAIAERNNYKIIKICDLKVTFYYDKHGHVLRQV